MEERLISIGAAASIVGVPSWKLRSWEEAGLLLPVRSQNGYRLYTAANINVAIRIRADEELGHRARLAPPDKNDASNSLLQEDKPITASGSHPSQTRESSARPLRRLAHSIGHMDGEPAVLQAVLDSALEVVHTGIGALSYADMTRQCYVLVASRGLSASYVKGIETWKLHEGLAGQSFGLREPIIIEDLSSHPDVSRDIVHKEGLRGYACVPLMRGQRRLGILEVFSSHPRRFDLDDLAPLEVVGATAAILVESTLLKRDLQQLRAERYRVISDWTMQTVQNAGGEREKLAAAIREEAARLAEGALTGRHSETTAERLENLAAHVEQGIRSGIDILPSIRDQLLPRISARTAKDIMLKIDDWPVSIPLDLSTRLFQVIDALVEPAAAAAVAQVLLVLGRREGNLTIEVYDNRDAPPGLDRLATVKDEARLGIRSLEGFIERDANPEWACGIRAVIPFAPTNAVLETLTQRERQVLEAMALGQPNRELAAALGITAKTLQNHLTAIYRKLGVTNRGQAMRTLAAR